MKDTSPCVRSRHCLRGLKGRKPLLTNEISECHTVEEEGGPSAVGVERLKIKKRGWPLLSMCEESLGRERKEKRSERLSDRKKRKRCIFLGFFFNANFGFMCAFRVQTRIRSIFSLAPNPNPNMLELDRYKPENQVFKKIQILKLGSGRVGRVGRIFCSPLVATI